MLNGTTGSFLASSLTCEISLRTAISSRSASMTSGCNSSRCTDESVRINVRAVSKYYRVGRRTNEKLFTDDVSVQRRTKDTLESRRRRRHRVRRVRMLGRLIYDRNDRTDARKLQVVSHNLGIRSPSTSRSAIVVSVVACSDRGRTNDDYL